MKPNLDDILVNTANFSSHRNAHFNLSIFQAQWFLFDKIRSEAFFGTDHPRLRVEIMVPKEMVGRIIGKGGKNVRELQRASGAIVKLPETDDTAQDQGGIVPVQILGTFDSDYVS